MQADPADQTNKHNVDESFQGDKKSKKLVKSTVKLQTLDEQVVYSLILSIHNFASNVTKNKITQKHQTSKVDEEKLKSHKEVKESNCEKGNQKDEQKIETLDLKLLEINGIKRSDLSQIIYAKLKPIPFSSMNDIRIKLRSSLQKIYFSSQSTPLKNTPQIQQIPAYSQISLEQLFKESTKAYAVLSSLLKECSIPTPIQEGFYQEYNAVWKQMIDKMTEEKSQKDLDAIFQRHLLEMWREVPHQSLNTHLQSFHLTSDFALLSQYIMIPQLSLLLVDNKIQQCCTYYETYFLAKYPKNDPLIPSEQISIFEDQVLIPKITKSEHIFSNHVLSLFKSNPLLKERLLNSHHLDAAVGVRIVDLLKEDGKKYPQIHLYCLKQHYKSIIYDHKHWWIVEDKLCFNNKFIEWYTQDLIKVVNGNQMIDCENNDKSEKIAYEIKEIDNVKNLKLSLLWRNGIIDLKHPEFEEKTFKQIPNPLYEKDRFDCSELIIAEIAPEQIEDSTSKFLKFEEFGFTQSDIKIIDQIDDSFEQMCQYLLKHTGKPIGFDTEFRCVSTKYQQQGVSLIQLSTDTKHYIIDFLKLQKSPQFKKFIVQLLCNQKYIKVGHTISSDIKYLTYTLHMPETMFIQSFIDITQIFKTLNPNEKFSSLSFLCLKFLNRRLSKYEQRSNWNRRPLRKAQIHYAALDAFACVLIYEKLHPEYQELQKHGKLYKAKLAVNYVYTQKPNEAKLGEMIQNQNENIEQKQTSEEPSLKNDPNFQVMSEVAVNNFIGDIHRSESLVYHKKFQAILSSQEPKFLVDNMLKKLSAIMRNCGIDAEYIAVRDYQLASAIAQKQSRIILTRDTKFFQRKDNKLPIYLIKQKTDSEKMFEEITHFFKINLSLFTTLSRCVKCNGPELVIIETEEARKEIKFKYEDSTVKEFWRCTKCKQIYWQGGQFERAKEKYAHIKKM